MILVTGGTGLLGSHLLFELTKKERSVRALYRSEEKKTAVKKIFDFYSGGQLHRYDSIEWMKGDVLDLISLEDAFQGIDTVYHCAAMVSFRRADFHNLIKINRQGTANMVNYSLKFGVKKFGHVSSTAAIGGMEGTLVTEASKWIHTPKTTGYAISKHNSEREVWRGAEEGLDVVILNPSVIFGAGDLKESSLTIFNTVKNGLKFYSPGKNSVVDARDVASVFVQLMESSVSGKRFLCVSENIPFKKMLEAIADALNAKKPGICPPKWLAIAIGRMNELFARLFKQNPSITLETARTAYSEMTYSNQKIKEQLDFSFYPLNESIQNVVDFYNWQKSGK